MTNEVWVLFKKSVPMDVYMSEESAKQNKFESETVRRFVCCEYRGDKTESEQLIIANLALAQRVEELTRTLSRAELRMMTLEALVGVPQRLRTVRVPSL